MINRYDHGSDGSDDNEVDDVYVGVLHSLFFSFFFFWY